jgi:hypothetical protein
VGLDAIVHCDCFEKGLLREPPPFPKLVRVSEEGRPEIYTEDFSKQTIFDQWEVGKPCGHERFKFIHHRIGNIDGVGRLRIALESHAGRYGRQFPIILEKVIYSGTHCGDMLNKEDVILLRKELKELEDILETGAGSEFERLEHFREQMRELVEASLALNKPIVF